MRLRGRGLPIPFDRMRVPVGIGGSLLFGLLAWSVYRSDQRSPYRVVHLLYHLREGERHAPLFDRILEEADFDQEASRHRTLRRIASRLREAEIERAALWASDPLPGGTTAWRAARNTWAGQMRRGHLRAVPGAPPLGTPRIRPGDSCVLGVLAAVPAWRVAALGNAEGALDRMAGVAAPHAVYVYYAPDPGQALDGEQAAVLYDLWSKNACPGRRPALGVSRLALGLALAAVGFATMGVLAERASRGKAMPPMVNPGPDEIRSR
jgi:hypothetical protein